MRHSGSRAGGRPRIHGFHSDLARRQIHVRVHEDHDVRIGEVHSQFRRELLGPEDPQPPRGERSNESGVGFQSLDCGETDPVV